MSERARGTILNINAFGAMLRLEDGRFANASADNVESHRADYERAYHTKKPLEFEVHVEGRRTVARLVPQIVDEQLESQIAEYLKSTQEWEKPDAAPAHERHFLSKKRRAALFESRHAPDS